MTRPILILALLAAGPAAIAAETRAAAPSALQSVSVSLPKSTRTLPNQPGVEAVQQNCTGCHSVGMILNQPSMAKPAWQAEVDKMRNVYKAPVDTKAVPAIVEYLAAVKGPK